MDYTLLVVIKLIDLTPVLFVIGMVLLGIWSFNLMYNLVGLEKKEALELKNKINDGSYKPYLKKIKILGYTALLLAVFFYLFSAILE
ncbi:MAG: hypothetical protein JJ971_11205 [Balneolaceae bacterium]|nr:hypothetical protein [Balneolaceae bacterium]MBO6546184.1 hypothetical protein [Balneolaceae bacterium]MBO6648542.1 hypothetical protein [Balneolaceae bacterium]